MKFFYVLFLNLEFCSLTMQCQKNFCCVIFVLFLEEQNYGMKQKKSLKLMALFPYTCPLWNTLRLLFPSISFIDCPWFIFKIYVSGHNGRVFSDMSIYLDLGTAKSIIQSTSATVSLNKQPEFLKCSIPNTRSHFSPEIYFTNPYQQESH